MKVVQEGRVASYLQSEHDDFRHLPEANPSNYPLIVLGDLHGNALKLLHFLIKQGVIETTADNYNKFYNLYHTSPPSLNTINEIKALIDNFTISTTPPFLRFLGDELADRGRNDFYTLYLLNKLDKSGVAFDINQSNHTVEFTLAHEVVCKTGQAADYQKTMINPKQVRSLQALSMCLRAGYITQQDVNQLVDMHKQHQRIISYSLAKEGGITLYSHAPVDYKVVHALAKALEIPYFDQTPLLLAYTIEQINQKYLSYVKNNQLGLLVNKEKLSKLASGMSLPVESCPLEFLLWSRDYKRINRVMNHPDHHYSLRYVHGHDSSGPKNVGEHVICLDSLSGKGDELEQCGEFYDHHGRFRINNPVYHAAETMLAKNQMLDLLQTEIGGEFLKAEQAIIEKNIKHLNTLFKSPNLACIDQAITHAKIKINSHQMMAEILNALLASSTTQSMQAAREWEGSFNKLKQTVEGWPQKRALYQLKMLCKNYYTHLAARAINATANAGCLLEEKQGIVIKLLNNLTDKSKGTAERLEQFKASLTDNRVKLEEPHHSFQAFLRGVAVILAKVLSFGHAYTDKPFSFFYSQGGLMADKAKAILIESQASTESESEAATMPLSYRL